MALAKLLDSVLEFDVKKNQVKKMARLPCALARMTTVRWRNQVVVLGGRDRELKCLNDVYMYDCKTGKITALPPCWRRDADVVLLLLEIQLW